MKIKIFKIVKLDLRNAWRCEVRYIVGVTLQYLHKQNVGIKFMSQQQTDSLQMVLLNITYRRVSDNEVDSGGKLFIDITTNIKWFSS